MKTYLWPIGANPQSVVLLKDYLLLEQKYRTRLWIGHGHSGLYGDDGEMQCGQCLLDFKRDPIEKIEAQLLFLPICKISTKEEQSTREHENMKSTDIE